MYPLQKGVYYIKKYLDTDMYYLEYEFDKFVLPDKIYGDTKEKIVRIWNHYVLSNKTTGCMFTGIPGSGKTEVGKMLCNLAIDNGLPVIMCIEIKFTIEVIRFISSLNRCVLFFDEFRKNISSDLESQMLSMLNDINNTNKLFIITENDSHMISQFIRDRPERVRYHYDYDKVTLPVFTEYVNDFPMGDEFKKDLEDLYKRASVFSFDHLQTLVQEHIHYPYDTLDELLSMLNLHGLLKVKYFNLINVINDDTKEEYDFSIRSQDTTEFVIKKLDRPIVLDLYTKPSEDKPRVFLNDFFIKYVDLERQGDSNIFIHKTRINLSHTDNINTLIFNFELIEK